MFISLVLLGGILLLFIVMLSRSSETSAGNSAPESIHTESPVLTPDASAGTTVLPNPSQPPRLTELRGSLARRREYDLWLIRNASNVTNSALAKESRQGKILSYCMATAYGAEHVLDTAPETEYALQLDGTVLTTPGKPPKTPEQLYRDGQRAQFEFETGGGPIVQDCAGSLYWFGTWHDKPMPSDEKFAEIAEKARADVDEIDKTLDSRLVEMLPKP